jgi:hypothetical protein
MKTERRQLKMWDGTTMTLSDDKHRRGQVKILLIVAWIVLLAGISHSLSGQSCTLACSDRLEVPLGTNCEVRLTPATIFTDNGADCPGQKNLILREGQNVITQAVDVIEFDLSGYVGSVLSLTAIDDDTDVSCTTILDIVDNTSPTISCPDTLISCLGDTSVAAIGLPIIEDNCDSDLDISYSDAVMESSDCNDAGIRVITRTWEIEDASGNGAACTQNIVVERPSLMDIDFPSNVNLSCESPDASPENTGFPQLDTFRLQTSSPCGLNVSFRDDTTMTFGGLGMIIARQWFVLRTCDAMSTTYEQIIEIKDSEDPSITCPEPFTVNTSVGDCTARLTLPLPEVNDNCDPNATFFVETSYGEMNIGPHRNVPVGTHSVRYVALDAFGNNVSCMTTFEVIDTEQPSAVCDDEVIVSLVDGGVAIARAISFDEGSNDNCIDQLYFKALRTTTGGCMDLNGDDDNTAAGIQEWYDDFVFFCCADADADGVPVQLRVFTANPGSGPVDPERMESGGDLFGKFNQCDLRVTIQDKIRPSITCPPSVTIDCRESTSDLSVFGSPIVSKTCGFTLDSNVVEDLDLCGTGVIYRNFTATTDNEIDASCTQVITIENQIALVDSNIIWPRNVDTTFCGGSIAVEDLPAGYDQPIIDFESCSLVAISSEDERFDLSYPACYKVFRYWSVIDWCQFGGSDEGRFDYRQTIQVQDEEAPVITCGDDITVGINGGSCNTAAVNIPLPTATDNCSPTIDFFNTSNYADDDEADASGTYPLGTTTVTFRASDRCGNVAECRLDVTVIDDRAPAPTCIEGLVATLTNVDESEISATVMAEIFLANRNFGVCQEPDEITVSMRRAINNPIGPPLGQSSVTFSCDDIGMQEVEIWLTDPNNNSDYCTTFVEVQDNRGICPQNTVMGTIAGSIRTEQGKEVENAVISVMNTTAFATMTGVDGAFRVDNLPFGENLTLVPSKNDDLMNGVSTMDMIIISKHILGLERITSPYALIAADIDGSGGISTLDLIRLRKLVLNEADSFPNEVPSWRFIDADFVFPEGENPLKLDFPELKKVESFNTATGSIRFVAVKMGDVNGTVRPNSVLMSQGRTTNGDVVMRTRNQRFEAGETFTAELYSEDLFNLIAFQFTLDYDERLLELVDFTPGDLPELSRANFSTIDRERGLMTTSWNEENTVLTIDKGTVCTMTFRAIRSGDLYTALDLNSDPTVAEAYNYNSDPMQVLLQFVDEGGSSVNSSDFHLYQNHPNPFQGYTSIGFVMPKRANATLSIYDLTGKMIYQHRGDFNKGYNELELSSAVLPAHGLYYYRLESDEFSATRKMIYAVTR